MRSTSATDTPAGPHPTAHPCTPTGMLQTVVGARGVPGADRTIGMAVPAARPAHTEPLVPAGRRRPAAWARRVALITLIVAVFAALLSAAADAGTYPMYQCTPSNPSVSGGWSVYSFQSEASTVLSNGCSASGGTLGDYVFSHGQAGAVTEDGDQGSQVGLALEAPGSAPDITIKSISATVTASGVSGDDAFLGFASDGQNLPGAVELPYGSSSNYVNNYSWILPEGARNFDAYVNCTTDHSSTSCYFANAGDVPALNNITLTLEDDTPPSIADVSGALASAAAGDATISGSQTIGFSTHDTDSGMRSATLSLTPQNGGNGYSHTFDFSGECTYQSWNACPLTQTVGSFTLNTAELQDGNYSISLSATDAAGNSTTQTLGSVRASNAPANTGLPSILTPGQILAGNTLDATPGEWSVPGEAGAVSYAYQWQQCDSQGESCESIAGAQTSSYIPTSQNVGHTLRVSVAASDRDGHSTATSQATSLVGTDESPPVTTSPEPSSPTNPTSPSSPATSASTTNAANSASNSTSTRTAGTASQGPTAANSAGAPNGAGASDSAQLQLIAPSAGPRSYTHSAITIAGRLVGEDGQPIGAAELDILTQDAATGQTVLVAHARTQPDGSFTAAAPAGPSRQIIIAYRAFSGESNYTIQASIDETVDANVRLHITPRHTGSHATIILSGQVQGPVPSSGVLVELLVHYLGHWEPFRTPRTNSHGAFHIDYQFQGAIGAFPFRAEIPDGQAGFPYGQGQSSVVVVRTR